MVHALLFVLSLAGFVCLALAMERHQRDLCGDAFAQHRSLRWRIAGWALLLLALATAVLAQGVGFGLASLSGHTSVAAAVVVLALMLRARQRP
ncbi:DUF3325 family protein [Stenotrophomonas lactitubi]|jgi:putative Mn2+ efflux pump MntP|uniref:DUF3325 family protein n=1 Tax=Stenotrophomonas lactitubi TaxID=2045214 RepID=UPI0035C0C668